MIEFAVAKLELKEGDFLVFKYIGDVEIEDVECLSESLQGVLPKGVTALIIGDNIELTKVTKEE